MADCRFLTYHGWGFDANCWVPWKNKLEQYGVFDPYDRGYFGEPSEPRRIKGEETLIVLTHSFGLHWCDPVFFEAADLLVIFGGFLRFHPQTARFRRRSRLVLQQMINEFEVRPEKVLADFYRNCYAPRDAPDTEVEHLDHDRMLNDLKLLHEARLDSDLPERAETICILHGADDYIVPKSRGREIYNRLQHKARYLEVRMGGHALPFSHHEQTFEFLKPHLDELLNIRQSPEQ